MAGLASPKRGHIGPTDASGLIWATLLALALLTCVLRLETQRIAYLDGYRSDLGAPIVGHVYQPFAVFRWMLAVDQRFDLQRVTHGGAYFLPAPHEQPWAHAAFAAFRIRFAFEAGAAFLLFVTGAALWARRKPTSGLYGSEHWATAADQRRSPLTRSATGTVLSDLPHKYGISSGCAYIGTSQPLASASAEPAWSKCPCVRMIASGRVLRP